MVGGNVRIVFYILFSWFFITDVHAAKFYQLRYTIRESENFSMVLKRFVKEDSIINIKSATVKKTMKKNPRVLDWRNLTPGFEIELFIEEPVMDLAKYKVYEDEMLKKIAEIEEKTKSETKVYPEGLKTSFFYMASVGIFTQQTPTVAKINFFQNSPISLGTSATYYPKKSRFSYSGSVYYSLLTATGANISDQTIDIPPEIGFNGYLEYRWEEKNVTVYGGADYESFASFNMEGLQNDKKIYVDENSVLYATVGLSKAIHIFDRPIFIKTSLSKSISSSYTKNAPPPTISVSDFRDEGAYDGYKFLFYTNYKFSDRFYFHSLFKYHTMTGPSDLTTLRIGVGFGYVLF